MSLHELAQRAHAALPEDLRAIVEITPEVDRGTLRVEMRIGDQPYALAFHPRDLSAEAVAQHVTQSVRATQRLHAC